MKNNITQILILVTIIGLIITLPALIQNNLNANKAEKDIKTVFDLSKKLCKSGCTDYPKEWIIPGKEIEAELYCMRQCKDNMKNIREEYLNKNFPILFTNEYNYRVSQIYCILGLVCPQSRISDLIENY